MEGKAGVILRIRADGWGIGGERGELRVPYFMSRSIGTRRNTKKGTRQHGYIDTVCMRYANSFTGSPGPQVHRSRISLPYPLLWCRKCHCERLDHVEVCASSILSSSTLVVLIIISSVVLWVSQNMEDDYTYNLAL